MQSIRILERRAQEARRDSNDNAALLSSLPRHAGAHADYRRDDYIFPRTQSLEMRTLSWEDRMPRIRHWGSNFVANLAFDIFA